MKTTLLRILIRFLGSLPLPTLRLLGASAGWLLYRLPNRERENARVNLALCFPGMEAGAREDLLRRSLKETATTLLEMPAVWYGSTEKWLGRLEPGSVPDEIRQLLEQGKGLIVAMPHLGNFEISAHFFGSLGKATGLYRPPRKQGLESLMLEGRNRPGQNRMVATDRAGIRTLYQALSRGEIIVILPDQQPKSREGGAGVFAPFFGVPALTMTLVSRFARKSGAPVYFIGFVRQKGSWKYRVIGQEGAPAIGAADLEASAAALNAGVEALVRQYPEQYQWTYRRFREQPDGSNPYA
ncbi:MAG: lipid A biosynthesis acyltransferase [Gammaproteobacteria bacterium]|nr:MAG: lipid A biosynthesis acyltransferase [Gammaproteobacteria bacterium]